MKTNSIEFVAALVAAPFTLGASAFAGPGPRPQPVAITQPKPIARRANPLATVALSGHNEEKGEIDTRRCIQNPHGTIIVLR